MKDLLAAVTKLLDRISTDDMDSGGLLSRDTLRVASELRQEMLRTPVPDEEAWRALVIAWSIRCETLEEELAQITLERADDYALAARTDALFLVPDLPLVPGQVEMEAQSDG